jgi:membrane protein
MADPNTSRLRQFIQAVHALWTEQGLATHEESRASRLHRVAHFWLLALRSFVRNKCPLRATALAYTTLLALVPLLALVVSITTALLQEKGEAATRELIEQFVDAAAPQLKLVPKAPEKPVDARAEVVNYINTFIANVQAKALGATGAVALIAIAILLLGNIEDTFNEIWGVTRGRNWFRRVVQYWTALSLGPILIALLVLLLSSAYFRSAEDLMHKLPFIGRFALKAMPFVIVSLAFALLYKLIPNTQVNWGAALVGGVVGGCFWLLLNIFNALSLSRVTTMSKIYGTALGLVPIFLLGLYFSWLIVLFGAQVAYAYQNREVYVQERKAEGVNERGREFVALRLMLSIAQHFVRNEKPPTLLQLAKNLGVPSRLVGRVLQPLVQARLVLEVAGNETAYAPARPVETITCHEILLTLRTVGGLELETRDDPARKCVRAEFERIAEAERGEAGRVTLRQLLDELPGAAAG